uniref:Uncharacterized protein n=1 Tax=Parascaris equorum TaxID=6256 RepID=A0A914RKL7_PAREQ
MHRLCKALTNVLWSANMGPVISGTRYREVDFAHLYFYQRSSPATTNTVPRRGLCSLMVLPMT